MDKNHGSWVPIARTEGMSITVAGSETLVYDPASFMIHRLTPDVYAVWLLADGTRDIAAIATEIGLPIRSAESALGELQSMGLVSIESIGRSKFSRRLFIGGTTGLAAASTLIPATAGSIPPQGQTICWLSVDHCQKQTGAWAPASCNGGYWSCPGPAYEGILEEGNCHVFSSGGLPCNPPSQQPRSSDAVFSDFGLNDASDYGLGLDGNGDYDSDIGSVESTLFLPQSEGNPVVVDIDPDLPEN